MKPKKPTPLDLARQKYKKANPWRQSYDMAKYRCEPNNVYGKRGIKFCMTVEDFKFLWFRDQAYILNRPSIDRIDTKGNYVLHNCRFIELQENRWRYGRKPVLQYTLNGKFIKRYETLMRTAKETKIGLSSISDAAKGRNKKAGGYKWVFVKELHKRGG